MSAVEPVAVTVYRFAPVMPGRRRTFRSKAAAYKALALQLLTRKYTATEWYGDTENGAGYKTRGWSNEDCRDRWVDDEGLHTEWSERHRSKAWRDLVAGVARRLRMRDEHKAAPRG